jgi:hypothetical protein
VFVLQKSLATVNDLGWYRPKRSDFVMILKELDVRGDKDCQERSTNKTLTEDYSSGEHSLVVASVSC